MSKKSILIVEDEFIIADVLGEILQRGGYEVCGIADNFSEAIELIEKHQPGFVVVDIYLKGKKTGIDLANILSEKNIPFIYISANSNQRVLEAAKKTNPYGFVVKPFREKDVLIALDIALYRYENNRENGLHQNAILQKKIANILEMVLDWEHKLMLVGQALQPYIPFEYMSVGLSIANPDKFNEIGFLRLGFEEYQIIGAKELTMISKLKLAELAALKAKQTIANIATWYDETELNLLFKDAPLKALIGRMYDLRSHLIIPVSINGDITFECNFYSRRPDAYNADHLILADRFKPLLQSFIKRMMVDENNPLDTSLIDNLAIKQNIPAPAPSFFEGIIGSSHLLLNVFDQIIQVAPHNSSVLILGESGTGKEKIADRIHHLSPRKLKPFIKVNCAALPSTLIDSELFGHEKGSFTGAYERKIGKFELANTGTIFLDEIGEIPLELQVKLLRVLQEREIERIGGRTTIKTDVRVIAATNRNLEKEVAEGRFRLDLYYRLNVILITMPPLRERKEDIPALATYFLNIYNRKVGRTIRGISDVVLENMKQYNWPGNIRELENLIERGVLLSKEDVLNHIDIALPDIPVIDQPAIIENKEIRTMSENERAHIIAALKRCNGKIWGEGGAADLLNLPPTTLNSKMKKLGIKKDYIF
ncbi:regulatory protein, Fis family [Mucilaginibacter pineti]|uniref:Regulatory protein, Fis family n=1 Tax=Mucilaginibacter pineti TaxID=1391627 RepID=A0A1G6ZIT5_9SPHI|nr:sigma 54-interacting response regulator [Mucilaginibacter pineti]SDE02353.1 regulatory protein, Fis family [Mucilaginibacter pineti]